MTYFHRATGPQRRVEALPPSSPVGLTDRQLERVMLATSPLPPEKRSLALERVGAALRLAGVRRPSDRDLAEALRRALDGLQHAPAA